SSAVSQRMLAWPNHVLPKRAMAMPMAAAALVMASATWWPASTATAPEPSCFAMRRAGRERERLVGKNPRRTTSVHPSGVLVRGDDVGDGLAGDADGGRADQAGDDHAGEGLGLAVAVGMILVGGDRADGEAGPDDERAADIGKGFDGIGDEGAGMADDAGEEL